MDYWIRLRPRRSQECGSLWKYKLEWSLWHCFLYGIHLCWCTFSSMMAYHNRLFCLCDSGHETKAMMNNSGPRYKRSQLERRLNTDIIWCVVLLIIMCMTAAIGEYCHLLIHHTAATAGNCLILRGSVSWAAVVSLFTRSRSLDEQSERPCVWDRLTCVTCLSWLPCLLDYDHRAAGEVSTFIHF